MAKIVEVWLKYHLLVGSPTSFKLRTFCLSDFLPYDDFHKALASHCFPFHEKPVSSILSLRAILAASLS